LAQKTPNNMLKLHKKEPRLFHASDKTEEQGLEK
jgi:hypothetical protein